MKPRRETKTTIDDVIEEISKVVEPLTKIEDAKIFTEHKGSLETGFKLTSIKFWCVSCEKTYVIFKKDKNGKMEEQQICTHMTFKEAFFDAT